MNFLDESEEEEVVDPQGGNKVTVKAKMSATGLRGTLSLPVDDEDSGPPPCIVTLTCQRLKERPVRHIRCPDESLLIANYSRGEFIGRGTYGVVVKATEVQTGSTWAIKTVHKDKAGRHTIKLLEREITILKMVEHPHIIHLKEVFETPQKVFLVLELCHQALREVLRIEGTFTEEKTRVVIQRLTSAISYLHKNGIVHRDLKLENILVGRNPDDDSDQLFVKVTDFGLSVVKGGVGHENMLHCVCGTPAYMAPEIIQDKLYSQQCDIWAAGIIMYMLLSGSLPFESSNIEELYKKINAGQVEFAERCWSYCSNGAKSLLQGMLRVDPAYRLTANEILHHPWLLGVETDGDCKAPTTVLDLMHLWRSELVVPDSATSSSDTSSAATREPRDGSAAVGSVSNTANLAPKAIVRARSKLKTTPPITKIETISARESADKRNRTRKQ